MHSSSQYISIAVVDFFKSEKQAASPDSPPPKKKIAAIHQLPQFKNTFNIASDYLKSSLVPVYTVTARNKCKYAHVSGGATGGLRRGYSAPLIRLWAPPRRFTQNGGETEGEGNVSCVRRLSLE